ncbi:25664_t:CDS:2, partial [Gigaspora margarita]
YITSEGFSVNQFEANLLVNVNNVEDTQKWFADFEKVSKTTMPQTKGYLLKGQKVFFRQLQYCIHSNIVRQKQENPVLKNPNSLRVRNTECKATIHLRIEQKNLQTDYLLEVNIKYTHNYVVHSAKALSFRHIKDKVRDTYIELFKNGHSPAIAQFIYEDSLHLNYLGKKNGKLMVQQLKDEINSYNNSGKAFILCIVTNLMVRVYEKIKQSGEICYVDASASFEPLNISITLFYTSCIAGALPLGLIITSDELEITLEKGMMMLKSLLSQCAFFGRGPNLGPITFLTDNSNSEHNALGHC